MKHQVHNRIDRWVREACLLVLVAGAAVSLRDVEVRRAGSLEVEVGREGSELVKGKLAETSLGKASAGSRKENLGRAGL